MSPRSVLPTCLCCLAAWLLAPAVLRAGEPSASRLSMHLIAAYSPGAQQIAAAHPRVIKILDTHGPMLSAARAYKSATPKGLVVLRVYTQKRYSRTDEPAASARDFWTTVLKPPLDNLSAADRALIDYVEGPNECEGTPCWDGTLEDATWLSDFWLELAQKIADAGHKPCAFSIPVGNPPGTVSQMQQRLACIVPALRKCKQLGGAWSYHSYTGLYTTDVSTEMWYSLRYRQFYSYFAAAFPDLADLPIILTEGGVDTGGSPTGSGWQAHGDAAKYQDWLTWYDARLREDNHVIGCTLFQIGDAAGWPSFELEPVAGWLAGHIAAAVEPTIWCVPVALAASVKRGQNALPTSFTVTNVGGNTLDYAISDNASWLSATPAAGASAGEVDTIEVTYSTAALPAGTHTATIIVADAEASNSPQPIPVTLTVIQPADFDGDADVDYADLLRFVECMTGTDAGPVAAGCEGADFDADTDVDQSDFGVFQRCLSGAGLRPESNCAE